MDKSFYDYYKTEQKVIEDILVDLIEDESKLISWITTQIMKETDGTISPLRIKKIVSLKVKGR